MKLERWALFAEVVSGFAVIITLIFLILGINENTRATYAGNYQLLLSDINDLSLTVAQDDALSMLRSLWESEGWEALDELGTLRIRNLERSLFRIYETAYYTNEHRTLDVAETSSILLFATIVVSSSYGRSTNVFLRPASPLRNALTS